MVRKTSIADNGNAAKKPDESDNGYLDIPAFLRHQAD
jgi:cell division protein FtsZ